MEAKEDLSLSSRSTRSIFVTLSVVAVGVPALIVACVYAYAYLTGSEMGRHEWKNTAFYIWLFTMGTLLFVGYRERRGLQMGSDSEPQAMGTNESTAIKWERRKAKRLTLRLYALAFLLPLLGVAAAVAVLSTRGVALTRNEWIILFQCYWVSGMLLALRYALLSRKEGWVYRGENRPRD